ncbi:DUF2651 family protein [Pontibacillus salicampi]|uniref:DUF2651 family protein n=1 Tax=Pontibacillus salicampi TaxID=1449801 RepID=A0ABV6LKW6_9BACI
MFVNPFVCFILPIAAIVLGSLGYRIFNKLSSMPLAIAGLTLILSLTTYERTFLLWAFTYTACAFMAGLLTKLLAPSLSEEGPIHYLDIDMEA